MTRLIDANQLLDFLNITIPTENLQTINAVPIIRCKNCKHYAGEGMYCANGIIVHFDHFYCYKAERRKE